MRDQQTMLRKCEQSALRIRDRNGSLLQGEVNTIHLASLRAVFPGVFF